MKVDSRGQPVSEGTFGLYSGISARVVRTFIDPVKDNDETREIIANGGYILDCGEFGGEIVCETERFEATFDGETVKAQDGQIIGVGDKIRVIPGVSPSEFEKTRILTVRALYPIGALKGDTCLTIEEKRTGGPVDGYWQIAWGHVEAVVEKAKTKLKPAKDGKSVTVTNKWGDEIEVRVGDTVRAKHLEHRSIATVTTGDAKEVIAEITKLEDFSGEPGFTGKVLQVLSGSTDPAKPIRWYVKRIVEVLTPMEGAATPTPTREGEEFVTCKSGPAYVGGQVRSTHPKYTFTGCIQKIGALLDGKETVYLKLNEVEKAPKDSAIRTGADHIHWFANQMEVIATDELEADETEQGEGEDMATPKKQFERVDIVAKGTQIILPERMSKKTAIEELNRQMQQEEMDVNIMELIHGFPLDAAHAFVKALEKKYGWVNALPTPGFFGPQPPVMIGVQVDPDGSTVQIPWGQLGIPGISGKLNTGIQFVDNRPVFCIGGTIKQKDKGTVNDIAQMAREYLRENSIYKGKAVRVQFPEDPKKFSPLDHQPKFIPTADIRPEELIFSDSVEKQVAINLWTLIKHTAAVRAARIPIKRGVLVFGKYGVGKTLLAAVTARMAVQSGVTFIDLVDSRQLPQAIPFARMFGGVVVIFAEDIDRCDENGTRTDAFNEILNTIDGLTSKTDEVIVVMTTNHIERISAALLRPGRLDAVIEVHPPDATAVQRLIRLYARHLLHEDENISEVGQLLAGEIPAVVREVVERSKLAAIARGDVHKITSEDLLVQAEGMKAHLELLKDKPRDDRSELEKLGDAVGYRIADKLAETYLSDSADGVSGEHMGPMLRAKVEETTRRSRKAA